jgi:prevent-host-death family protein
MAEIGIKELKSGASRVVDEVAAGRSYVITKRGRPTAVLIPVEEAEDLVLANAEEFISMRRRAREAYRRGRSKSLRDLG